MSGDRPKSIPLNELSAKIDEAAKDVLRGFKPLATEDLNFSFFPIMGPWASACQMMSSQP